MKALLGLLGGGTLWWVVGAGALVMAGAFGVQHVRLKAAQAGLATERAQAAEERAQRAETGLRAALANLKESERRVSALEGVIRATQPALDSARAAADRVPDLDRRVRAATAALGACRRAGPGDPAAAAGGPAADETARVLAELQRTSQAAEAARTRYADEAGVAVERCAASYDAVSGP